MLSVLDVNFAVAKQDRPVDQLPHFSITVINPFKICILYCCRISTSGSGSLPELQLLARRGLGAPSDIHPAYRLPPYMEHLYASLHNSPTASLHGKFYTFLILMIRSYFCNIRFGAVGRLPRVATPTINNRVFRAAVSSGFPAAVTATRLWHAAKPKTRSLFIAVL